MVYFLRVLTWSGAAMIHIADGGASNVGARSQRQRWTYDYDIENFATWHANNGLAYLID